MKTTHLLRLLIMAAALAPGLIRAHPWHEDRSEPGIVFDEKYRTHVLAEFMQKRGMHTMQSPQALVASNASGPVALQFAAMVLSAAGSAPPQTAPFMVFAPKVNARWDGDFLYVESNGIPDHNMMVGITAWQQQVPLPHPYVGDNAWRIPLHPVVAKTPQKVENHFLRGAIALAVNGIPIFNPQNNRGEVSYEIGELDQWGGHCGRADDYHYHIAPLHLQSVVGKDKPVAYALDGYPIYGLTEPDGSPLRALDECHGHEDAKVGYHYHASTKRPYLQSAFHGEVVEAEGQVDPQPRANGVRGAGTPLRGAKITGFESTSASSYKLSYEVNGDKRAILYSINTHGTFPFEYQNGREGTNRETYTRRQGGGGGGPKGRGGADEGRRKGPNGLDAKRPKPAPSSEPAPTATTTPKSSFSSIDLNGDGFISAAEFAADAKRQFALRHEGGTLAEAMAKAREEFNRLDRNHDGQIDREEFARPAASDAPPPSPPPSPGGDEPPRGGGMKRNEGGGGGGRGGKGDSFVASPDQPRSSNGTFMLTSPEVEDLKEMPADFTGDGSAATLPLEWKGAPAGTQGYALLMDHTDPEGVKKWYWTLYDIPANVTRLPKNVQGVGKVGTGFKGQVGYEPPHSKGPGAKTYVITVYALSAPLNITQSPREVNREVLLAAIKGKVLASSSLRVVHTSKGSSAAGNGEDLRPPRGEESPGANDRSKPMAQAGANTPPPRPDERSTGGPPQGGPPQVGQRKPWMQQHGAELDINKDGVITMDELKNDLARAFAIYDRNKDGIITPEELEAAGDVREGAAFAGFIYRHFKELDANGDGNLSRDELFAAAKMIFDTADQDHDGKVTRAEWESSPQAPLQRRDGGGPPPQTPGAAQPAQGGPDAQGRGKGGGGKPDNKGLIKPTMADTVHVDVYADNWFAMFINGELVAVDSIKFTPHNVQSFDILPEYPMTIAVIAKDNADWNTGMEYGDHIGDGGFIVKFSDGTVSNSKWKAHNFFKGPLNHDTKNPVVVHTPIPDGWWKVDFDDSKWENATEYTEERVGPKEPFYKFDFSGAKFIWTDDLDLDNTIIFRTTIEKPGWKPRWNTKPDIDISGAPYK